MAHQTQLAYPALAATRRRRYRKVRVAQADVEHWLRIVSRETERLRTEAEEVREVIENARQTGEHMRAVLLNRRAREGVTGG